MTFPARVTLRVMAEGSDDLVDRCVAVVERCLDKAVLSVETRDPAKGTYVAVRLGVSVDSADELRAATAALKEQEGVRVVL